MSIVVESRLMWTIQSLDPDVLCLGFKHVWDSGLKVRLTHVLRRTWQRVRCIINLFANESLHFVLLKKNEKTKNKNKGNICSVKPDFGGPGFLCLKLTILLFLR